MRKYQNLRWQLYPSLGFSYRRYDDPFGPAVHVLCLGPFQFRWFGPSGENWKSR